MNLIETMVLLACVMPAGSSIACAFGFPGPVPGKPVGSTDGGRLLLENNVISASWSTATGGLTFEGVKNKLDGTAIQANGAEAFELVLADGAVLKSADFRVVGKPALNDLKPEKNAANLARRLAGKQWNVKLASADGGLEADWRAILRDGSSYVRQELTLTATNGDVGVKEVILADFAAPEGRTVGTVPGSPVVAGTLFFAYEHPLSRNTADNGLVRCALERNNTIAPGRPLTQSSAMGVAVSGNLRRSFLYYLERERAHPYRAFLHYNSWYDISLPNSLGQRMNEEECLSRIDGFGEELIVKRGVRFDSIVLDDGWDDFNDLWRIDGKRFPRGFKPLKDRAELYKTHMGLWISPWGGYSDEKTARLEYGKKHGFETNGRGFSLAGPTYYARFREVPLDAAKHNGVNYFKFDGIGAGSLDETESLMRLIAELRYEASNLFINTTTGTWPSPYWLWHGDSIWRGGNDMGQCGEGNDREKWINYRDATVYAEVVSQAPLYPLNSLMLHGIVNADHSMYPLPPSGEDFVHEVRSYFGSGTGIQELYITPGRMTSKNWDMLAETARWSRRNADVLVDTHWIGGDPAKGEVYGWAAWSKRKGIITLRCPSARPGKIDIDIGKAFELPAGAPLKYALKSPWNEESSATPVLLIAGEPFTFELRPFEVRVLEAYPLIEVGGVSDKRFDAVRDPDTPCDVANLTRYRNLKEWESRATQLRQQVLASAGLLPMPERTPLNAMVSGKVDRGDYVVEKVCFESYPGYFVTGNLYRPSRPGRFPAVLNPHGHWEHGRFEDNDICSVLGRCINFARQGYVAFSYDMVGYGDSWQLVHSAYPNNFYGNAREMLGGRYPDLNADIIGFRKDQLLWGISVGGLQLWNSIRAVDFLQSLTYVDKNKIACTGASGGGTQTYLLSAVDDRIKVCAPVCMISAKRQGGCLCENLPNLRIDTNNVEFAALMAPRPMILISATGDWTRDVPNVELQAIRHIYDLYGAGDRVSCVLVDDEHNYNQRSREAVYSWFGRWLPDKPLSQPVAEQTFRAEAVEDLRVFPDKNIPKGALDRDGLVSELTAVSGAKLEADRPKDRKSLKRFRRLYSPALRHALSLYAEPDVEAEVRGEDVRPDCVVTRLVLRDKMRGAEIPAIVFSPSGKSRSGAVLMVHEDGKPGFLGAAGASETNIVDEFVKDGRQVMLIDCFETGEHVAPEKSARRSRSESPDESSDYEWSFTYNRTDTAERVYDILCALDYLRNARPVSVVGGGRAGLWCMLACAFAGKVDRVVCDTAGFDTSNDEAFVKDLDVPCLRKAGDFNTAIAMIAPGMMLIHNTQGKFDTSWVGDVYKATAQAEAVKVVNGKASDDQIIRWVLGSE